MNFVIDDLRTLNADWPHARTSAEGLAWLKENDQHVDCLWLDHDLGGDDTIMVVVDWLCEIAHDGEPYDVGTISVHSMNPVGAENAVRSLKNCVNLTLAYSHASVNLIR